RRGRARSGDRSLAGLRSPAALPALAARLAFRLLCQGGELSLGRRWPGRLAVGQRRHLTVRARQWLGAYPWVAGGPQSQVGRQGDAQPGRGERLRDQDVVGGERDLRSEADPLALPGQVAAAALAASDPP